jgi:hypothetical protein
MLRENAFPSSLLLNSLISNIFVQCVLCFILVRRRTKLHFRRNLPVLPNFNHLKPNGFFMYHQV